MGEYEPEDSRDVTLTDGHAPGEPPRTGPREGETRRKPAKSAPPRMQQPDVMATSGQKIDGVQQKGIQMRGQSQKQSQTQSQKQDSAPASQGSAPQADARRADTPQSGEMNNDIEEGPLAGDQPQGIDNTPGSARPEYDQYELNSPQNMHHDRARDEAQKRQAEGQSDTALKESGSFEDDAEDVDERGYGDAAEDRLDKLED